MKPIAFSRPMVLARRAGRKTQTRRLIKPQPPAHAIKGTHDEAGNAGVRLHFASVGYPPEQRLVVREDKRDIAGWKPLRCPYTAGEQLWVREDFQVLHRIGSDASRRLAVRYLADNVTADVTLTEHELSLWNQRQFPYRATPGRFMYQSLARDKPTVRSVCLERLLDITADDVLAEGVACVTSPEGRLAIPLTGQFRWPEYLPLATGEPKDTCIQTLIGKDAWSPAFANHILRAHFFALWESIHGPGSCQANPWVWVLELTPFQP